MLVKRVLERKGISVVQFLVFYIALGQALLHRIDYYFHNKYEKIHNIIIYLLLCRVLNIVKIKNLSF
jgi:hypothetical protein